MSEEEILNDSSEEALKNGKDMNSSIRQKEGERRGQADLEGALLGHQKLWRGSEAAVC